MNWENQRQLLGRRFELLDDARELLCNVDIRWPMQRHHAVVQLLEPERLAYAGLADLRREQLERVDHDVPDSLDLIGRDALLEQVRITVMLESKEAFRNIEEIAAVAGIDTLAIGPADLAQELGVYGTPDESKHIEEYKLRMREVALESNKTFEMGAWSTEDAARWLRVGVHLLTYVTETTVLRNGFAEAAALKRDLESS